MTSATYNITGLTPSTDYVVRVKAICDTDTESDWSAEIPFTTLAGQVTTYVITASASGPGTITPNGTVTVQEGSDVTFTFEADENAVVDRLLVDDAETAVPARAFNLREIFSRLASRSMSTPMMRLWSGVVVFSFTSSGCSA